MHRDIEYILEGKTYIDQGTAISDASNLCTAVGGDTNKNSGAKHQSCGKGDNNIYCYRRHEK